MKAAKRWGVMTLVALLVLGSMGAALADDDVETEDAKDVLEPDSYGFVLDWAQDVVDFVFYWGFDEGDEPECPTLGSDTSGGGIFGFVPVPDADECFKVPIKKPNHGSMVSGFVHWLKESGMEYDGSKGQLVKQLAKDGFGKGFFELDEDPLAEVEAEDDDGNGPPDWVKEKKGKKVKGKK